MAEMIRCSIMGALAGGGLAAHRTKQNRSALDWKPANNCED